MIVLHVRGRGFQFKEYYHYRVDSVTHKTNKEGHTNALIWRYGRAPCCHWEDRCPSCRGGACASASRLHCSGGGWGTQRYRRIAAFGSFLPGHGRVPSDGPCHCRVLRCVFAGRLIGIVANLYVAAECAIASKHFFEILTYLKVKNILHGIEKSAEPEQNLRVVGDFASRLDVLEYGSKGHDGDIRSDRRLTGTPIGVNDVHIAVHTRCEGLVVATNHRGAFERVAGIQKQQGL